MESSTTLTLPQVPGPENTPGQGSAGPEIPLHEAVPVAAAVLRIRRSRSGLSLARTVVALWTVTWSTAARSMLYRAAVARCEELVTLAAAMRTEAGRKAVA